MADRIGDSPFDPPGFGTLGGGRRRPREADESDLARRGLYESPPSDAVIDEIRPSGTGGLVWRVSVSSECEGIRRLGVAKMDRAVIDSLRLTSGTAWTRALADQVLEACHHDAAKRYALNALSVRQMSRGRLRENMVRRGTPKTIADLVVQELADSGLIDDRVMAESIARSLLAQNPCGARMVEYRLRRRAIEPELARAVAIELTTVRDAGADALRVARKRLRSMSKQLDRSVIERRLVGSLARRGFAPGVCRSAARDAMSEPCEVEPR